MSIIFTRATQEQQLKHFLDTKTKDDIGIYYHHDEKQYCIFNIEEWTAEMKRFRKYVKKNEGVINPKNHREPMIQGKQFYTFVFQDPDMSRNPQFDPMGLAFETQTFVVSGMIYAFRKKENRDMSYKYIMGIKD